MKREAKGFIAGVIITSTILFGIPTFAASISKSITASINSVKIALNGKVVSVDNISYKGNTYVQLGKFCDLIGKTAIWDSKTKTVDVSDKISEIPAPKEKETKNENPVVKDSTKPLVSEVKPLSGNKIEITFNEKMNKTAIENIANYTIYEKYGTKSKVQILKAENDSTGYKVVLTSAPNKEATLYSLEVQNITDLEGNIIDKDIKNYVGMKYEYNPTDFLGDLTIIAINTSNTNTVEVEFSNKVDESSAENVSNYSINEMYGKKVLLSISTAKLDSTGRKVVLTTSNHKDSTLYKIEVDKICDLEGKAIDKYESTYVGIGAKSDYPLTISSVTALSNTTIEVVFSQKVEKSYAETISNYSVREQYGTQEVLTISKAELDANNNKVILTTNALKDTLYNLKIANIRSIYGTSISEDASKVFAGIQ